jgi:hypothetical protein
LRLKSLDLCGLGSSPWLCCSWHTLMEQSGLPAT